MTRTTLPIQFLIVVVVSLALTIFFGAWAADSRVEAREGRLLRAGVQSLYAGGNAVVAAPSYSPEGQQAAIQLGPAEASQEWWERSLLLVCPLH